MTTTPAYESTQTSAPDYTEAETTAQVGQPVLSDTGGAGPLLPALALLVSSAIITFAVARAKTDRSEGGADDEDVLPGA